MEFVKIYNMGVTTRWWLPSFTIIMKNTYTFLHFKTHCICALAIFLDAWVQGKEAYNSMLINRLYRSMIYKPKLSR